jgi:SNF2 family DNA or RNA helicase
MYDSIVTELETLDKNGTPFSAPTVLAALQRLRQIAVATPEVISDEFDSRTQKRLIRIKLVEPSSKLDALMDVIEELQWDEDAKQQIVVFSNFKDPLNLLEVRLKAQDIPFIHLQTEDNDDERFKKWSVEWPKKEHQVFLSTVSLGGESINLTSAQHICFLDRSWSPKDNSQAIGRVRRPGQEGQPVVVNIEALNTTDQYVEETNIRKDGWFQDIFGNNNV